MKKETYTVRISADQPWFHVPWREIWEYRDLIGNFIRRDLTAIYKQSILGPLWFVLVPLLTTVVFTVIFGNVAKVPTDGIPPFLFYMCNMVLWNYFQNCFSGISNSLIKDANVFGKVYFPRISVALSLLISNLVQLTVNFLVFVGFYFYFFFAFSSNVQPSWWVLLFPLLVLQCALVALGSGLWLAALTAKYRDITFALPFIAQLWLYGTPIVYPASLVPAKYQWLFAINPLTWIVELNRCVFLGVGTVSAGLIVTGISTSLVFLFSGFFLFNKVQRTFVDTI
jgi:lipopolysaccharide transport system permease protein